jgi:transcriptional regulator with GAF, ATPase, and Fis domain
LSAQSPIEKSNPGATAAAKWGRRVSDRRVKLLRQWLKAGVMEEGKVCATILGMKRTTLQARIKKLGIARPS